MPFAIKTAEVASSFNEADVKRITQTHQVKLGIYGSGRPLAYLSSRISKAMDDLTVNLRRINNFLGIPLGESEEFIWIENANSSVLKDVTAATVDHPITAVHEYGRKHALKLAVTTMIMQKIARESLTEVSKQAWSEHHDLLSHETVRGRDVADRPEAGPSGAMLSFLEGIQSMHDSFVVLTAHKISGVTGGRDALKQVIFNGGSKGLVSEFAASIPLGLIGPLGLSGKDLGPAVVLNESGKVGLFDQVKAVFRQAKEILHQRRSNEKDFIGKRGVCPFALLFKGSEVATKPGKTGLQILSESYWHIFEIVDKAVERNEVSVDLQPIEQGKKLLAEGKAFWDQFK